MNALKSIVRNVGLHRRHIAAMRMYAERSLLAMMQRPVAKAQGRILAYHAVGEPAWGVNDVSPARFRRHLDLALAAGHTFVPAEEIARTGGRSGQLAITFDDGAASVATHAAPILKERNIPWTLFIVSSWADGKGWSDSGQLLHWTELDRLVVSGATLGSHSVSHRNFRSLSGDEAAYELYESRRMIESRLGIAVRMFAIPFGRACDWTMAADRHAREAGYDFIYAYCEDLRFPSTVPRTPVTRFDGDRTFRTVLAGGFDRWQEWM